MTARMDWPGLLRAGVRALGLSPAQVWALTPAELRLLLGPETGREPMPRARLEELLAAFPDRTGETDG